MSRTPGVDTLRRAEQHRIRVVLGAELAADPIVVAALQLVTQGQPTEQVLVTCIRAYSEALKLAAAEVAEADVSIGGPGA